MTYKATIAAACIAAAGTPVFAQVTGGELGIEYNAPIDGSDFGGTTYSGGIEYGFMQTFSVSANVAGYKFDNIDTDASNVTLHATYHLSSAASAGAFFARDDVEDGYANIYGIEGGTEFMGGDIGGYIGRTDTDGEDATLFGVDGTYSFGNGFALISDIDLLSIDDTTLSQASFGAEYQLQSGPSFYAQVGRISASVDDDSDSVGFVTIGAKVAFGAQRGTTFENRSILEVIPGF